MAQLKFYRGAQGDSLPVHQDGAIYIVDSGDTPVNGVATGKMYVDTQNNRRLGISGASVHKINKEDLANMANVPSTEGTIYLILEQKGESNEMEQVGIKIGDGLAYIVDLPMYSQFDSDLIAKHVTATLGNTIANVTGTGDNRLILSANISYSV